MTTKTQYSSNFHKRNVHERWESSPRKRTKPEHDFPDTSSHDIKHGKGGKFSSSLGNEKKFLVIESKMRGRAESMELIPACVPESVGFEIENIIQNSFGKDYEYDLPKEKKLPKKRTSPQKKKSPRTLSTEDLPPNLLPEDYLDEVISQYFNSDVNHANDNATSDKTMINPSKESLAKNLSDNSDNDNDDDDENTEEEDERAIKINKVKTDEEIEHEYKHIIFGAKKRKGPRLGLVSPKKKKKDSKGKSGHKKKRLYSSEISVSLTKDLKVNKKQETTFEGKKVKKKKRKIKLNHQNNNLSAVSNPSEEEKVETIVSKPQRLELNQNKETKTAASSPSKEEFISNEEPITVPKPPDNVKCSTETVQTWSGKKASRKAFDRSKMLLSGKKLFTSPKIEDVTGKYGVEEELVTCAICNLMDPPVDPENPSSTAETTEWVGCDCYRWYHKSCTKLTKFTEKFSCKSVRKKCQEVNALESISLPTVLQVAILKFIRDRDVSFIEDLLW